MAKAGRPLAPLRGARRPGPLLPRVVVALAIGFGIGIALGVVFMGTTHAILESKGAAHYGQDGASEQQQQQRQRSLRLGGGGGSKDAQLAAAGGSGRGDTQQAAAGSGSSPGKDTIHTLCTGNGSPYQNYQLRIAYATYKLIQQMPGGERHVAFTRILHRTKPDHAALMQEIETFRADPLQPACDNWCEYPVSDRANAVRQFFDAAEKDPSMIKGEWLYMIESDYVFMKPLPIPDAASQSQYQAWGYPFDYIRPTSFPDAMKKLYPGPVADIPGTGPAPILMRAADWKRVTPDWERLTAQLEADPALVKQLGWVREMYAFSAALATQGIKTELKKAGETPFISQLPIDESLGAAHAFHYTQCTIWKTLEDNKDVWAFDKRFHTSLEESLSVPPLETPPTFQPGKWKTIEGKPISESLHRAVEQMIGQMNAGIKLLKPIPA